MPLRLVANAPWLSLARAALVRPEWLRPASLAHRHNFPHPPTYLHPINKVDSNYFTPPENPLSILEHAVSEYNVVAEEFNGITAENANEHLQGLVKARDWPGANRLRAHMLSASFPIQPSSIYVGAAFSAVKHAAPERQIDEFVAWLTFLPDIQDACSHNFEHLINELPSHPSLIGPSGLVLTTKGYLDLVRSRIVPLLATYAEPELKEHFLRLYEQEGSVFATRKLLHPAQETISHKQMKVDHMFEDLEEYADVHVNVEAAHTTEHLEHLVADGQYHAALLLRQEFEEWNIPIPPSPVYALAAQQAVTKLLNLAALKKDTLVDDDLVSSAFSSWFSLVPNASQNGGDLKWLDDTRHYLLTMPRTNVPVIRQFGLMAAEKGYMEVVFRRLIPHVIRLSSPEMSCQFLEQSIDYAKKAPSGACAKFDDRSMIQIMEAAVREFAIGGHLDAGMQLLTQCDENNIRLPLYVYDFLLRQLQKRPKRSAVLAPQVRNMKERWYPQGAVGLTPEEFPAPDHELARLVESGQFDQATELLSRWTEPAIPLDHWYSLAAEHALQHPNADKRLEMFIAWFNLVPEASLSTPRHFGGIKSYLLPLSQDTQIAIAFALACARKGYLSSVIDDIIPGIIKKGFPFTTARFLDELIIAVKEASIDLPPLEARMQLLKVFDVCVTVYCEDRRPKEAVTFLRSQERHGIRPRRKVLDMLIGICKDYYEAKTSHPNILYLRQLQASSVDSVAESSDLVADLRYWRRTLSPSNQVLNTPNPHTAASFLENYTKSGRTKALSFLRNKALRSEYPPLASAWISGEMLFHQRQKNYQMVITIFASYFTLVGVPRLLILDYMQKWEQQHELPRVSNPRGRALPGPRHVALVWHAMLQLAQDQKSLSALYNQFRQEMRISQSHSRTLHVFRDSLIGDTKEAPRSPPTLLFDSEIWSGFIFAFRHHYSAKYGVRIILDMIRMRLAPNAHQLTLVAEAYAKQGEARSAISILNLMSEGENIGKEQLLSDKVAATPVGLLKASILASGFSIPAPIPSSYTRVIRRFLSLGNLAAAHAVRKLVQRQPWYKPGVNSELDKVIQILEVKHGLETNRKRRHYQKEQPSDLT